MKTTLAMDCFSQMRRRFVRSLIVSYVALLATAPTTIAVLPIMKATSRLGLGIAVVASPGLFMLSLVTIAAGLSTFTRKAIISGRFPRELGHVVYGPRRLYGICWTSLYYSPALYHAILAIPILRRWTFRAFGYSGQLDFTCYPDTWIRDLPLLEIGAGAYLGNRATLGSNICLQSGEIQIGRIKIGSRAMIGHMSVIGLGNVIGDDAEIGVTTTLGVNVLVGARSKIGARCGLDHGVRIGAGCVVESASIVGKKASLADGLIIRFGSIVPARARITSQSQADRYAPGVAPLLIDSESGVRNRSVVSTEDLGSGDHDLNTRSLGSHDKAASRRHKRTLAHFE